MNTGTEGLDMLCGREWCGGGQGQEHFQGQLGWDVAASDTFGTLVSRAHPPGVLAARSPSVSGFTSQITKSALVVDR